MPGWPGWREVSKVLGKLGFQGRTGKSHLIFTRTDAGGFRRVTVPLHDHLKTGTFKAILRQAGITEQEFDRLV